MSEANTVNVLFVCTGNICRSPMAEQMLQQMVAKENLPVRVASAGVAAMIGEQMTVEAQQAIASRGYKVNSHAAQDLVPGMLEEADLVLAMTLEHRSEIARLLPKVSRRSFTLDEFARLASFLMNDPEYLQEFKKKDTESREEYLDRAIQEAVLLRGMVPTGEEPKDVEDPYGESIEVYSNVRNNIEAMLRVVIDWMNR